MSIMITEELIGRESPPVAVKVTEEGVRRFAEAIGMPFDGTVPPTFIITLLEARIPGLDLPLEGAIHGEQKFIYHRPLQIGETYRYTRSVQNVYRRRGKLGEMIFVPVETRGTDLAGEPVFTAVSTVIIPHREDGQGDPQGGPERSEGA